MNGTQKFRTTCPMPQFDFEQIQMGHGSGGILTRQLLETGVFTLLQNPLLDQRHDGAVFQLEGPLAFSTDSYVVHPIFFPGGNIGELAVNGTVNDLAMCGAMAKYLSLSFIIEEGLPMHEFWEIMQTIARCAKEAGVQIVTGDTKVVERNKGDKIYINTSGIGKVHPDCKIGMDQIIPGDVLLLNGPIAAHGMAIMSQREGLSFQTDIVSDTAPLNYMVQSLLEQLGTHIHFLRDATRGGLGGICHEIASASGLGLTLREKDIRLDPQVEGACEMLGIDPLYVANEGIFLIVVDCAFADKALEVLRLHSRGFLSAPIGTVTSDHRGQVVMESKIGGKRLVPMIPGELLPRIC